MIRVASRVIVIKSFNHATRSINVALSGQKLLAKISDEGAKANCFLSF